MNITPVNLSRKPPIFFDYLNHFEKVSSFYSWNPHDDSHLIAALKERSRCSYPRQQLVDTLLQQHRAWEAPDESIHNIHRLNDKQTFCIVTGQQAGVLGGPLYTIYKIITVIKLAITLQEKYPDYHFIPVFWMEINDNDFKEINHIQYITRENELKRLEIAENPEDHLKPIAYRTIDAEMLRWKEILEEDFFDTEFKEDALNLFLDPYAQGDTYGNAFARLLLRLFHQYGLVILNPVDSGVTHLAQPIFHRTLSEADVLGEHFLTRNREIEEAGYPTQIHLRRQQTLLFFIDEHQRRVRIDKGEKENQFHLVYSEEIHPIGKEELLRLCETHPEQFSPNVALRPVLQDFLLPTVVYVAGPSETSYFAQLGALYDFFEIPMPVIYPRHRLTIVEKKIQRLVEKLELDYQSILQADSHFIENYLRNSSGGELYEALEKTDVKIVQALEELAEALKKFDPTLIQSVQKTRSSIESSLGKLSGKITRSLEEKNKTMVNQLQRIFLHLLPGNNYQERELNLIYFVIKYGTDLIPQLITALPEDSFRHLIVEL